jgi:hypothetical protein
MNQDNLSQKELLRQVRKFVDDPNRGISMNMFYELCGISRHIFEETFIKQTQPMSVTTQIRVNKALRDLRAGRVKVMRRPDRTHYVDYRREDAPVMRPKIGLVKTADGIKIRIGLKNRSDYSDIDLDEAMRG